MILIIRKFIYRSKKIVFNRNKRCMKYISVVLISALLVGGISCDDDDDDDNGIIDDNDDITLNLVAEGFNSPVFLTQPPGDTERIFVVDQTGQIHIIKDGALLDQPFLDIQDRIFSQPPDERGLLGLAFHP